ncbi:MAG: TetR/AcrR family transcriptional regulator [Rhodospirillaceae bacterium]|nr:TetR/AcrR family transcriptional regulator [Rhodospirillaceae bacterium]
MAKPQNARSSTAVEERRENRREEILRAAQDLFHRQGYANTSLDDIARAVGIKREGVYYYFPNRTQILITIIKPLGLQLRDRVREILESDASPEEKICQTVENHLMRFENRFAESKITLRDDYFAENEDVLAEMQPIWDEYETLWVAIISEGQDKGAFDATLDPRLAHLGILGLCNWVARWYKPGRSIPVPDLIAMYNRMVLRSLRAD